jgi:Family of unknown function (DUF6055)
VDFLGEWATHNVTWDYQNPPGTAADNQGTVYRKNYGSIMDKSKADRRLRSTQLEPLDTSYAANRRFVTPSAWAPQRWGYNIVRLYPDAGATTVTVTFRGVTQAGADSDWRAVVTAGGYRLGRNCHWALSTPAPPPRRTRLTSRPQRRTPGGRNASRFTTRFASEDSVGVPGSPRMAAMRESARP